MPVHQGLHSQFDPAEYSDESGSGKDIASKLVVAGSYGPSAPDAAEEIFDRYR
jgi:hypothetical protein